MIDVVLHYVAGMLIVVGSLFALAASSGCCGFPISIRACTQPRRPGR